MRFSELREKEVINLKDCQKLGYVSDLEIDVHNGCVQKMIVPKDCKFWGLFGGGEEYIIPFCNVKQIGPDIIIVELK